MFSNPGLANSTSTVSSCTLAYNTTGHKGGGIAFRSTTNANICLNSIVYYNRATAGTNDIYAAGALSLSNSCASSNLVTQGNTTNSPKFVLAQAVGGDFRLLKGSPCIDTGLNEDWMTNAFDLDVKARIFNTTVDMGCYEYWEVGRRGTMLIAR
ncbi:MAG: choice-of-anchor Q domain-containing protein [bacterium]